MSLCSSNSTSLGYVNVVESRELFLIELSVEGYFSIGENPKVDCVNVLL